MNHIKTQLIKYRFPIAGAAILLLLIIFIIAASAKSDTLLLRKRSYRKAAAIIEKIKAKNSGSGGSYKPDVVSAPISYFDYYVKSGDSIYSIAKDFGIDALSIVSANSMKYAALVRVGAKLKVPGQDGLTLSIASAEELDDAANKYNIDKDELLRINSIESASINSPKTLFIPGVKFDSLTRSLMLGEFFRRPAYGRFSSYFGVRIDPWTGRRSFHQGVDIANANGGPIYAAASGTVIYTGWSWIYGNMVKIKHVSGYVTMYGHLDSIGVKVGQSVSTGTVIARMGTTGRSTGVHLHFEIRQYGRVVNPFKVTVF